MGELTPDLMYSVVFLVAIMSIELVSAFRSVHTFPSVTYFHGCFTFGPIINFDEYQLMKIYELSERYECA